MKRADFIFIFFFGFFFSLARQCFFSIMHILLQLCIKVFTAIIFFPTDIHNDDTWYMRKQGNLIAYYYRFSYTNDLSSCIIKQPCYLRHRILHLLLFSFSSSVIKPFSKKNTKVINVDAIILGNKHETFILTNKNCAKWNGQERILFAFRMNHRYFVYDGDF